jgi:hypothetical protein
VRDDGQRKVVGHIEVDKNSPAAQRILIDVFKMRFGIETLSVHHFMVVIL